MLPRAQAIINIMNDGRPTAWVVSAGWDGVLQASVSGWENEGRGGGVEVRVLRVVEGRVKSEGRGEWDGGGGKA